MPDLIKRNTDGKLIIIIAIMSTAVMAMTFLQPILPLYLSSINVAPSVMGLMFSIAMVGMVFGESSGGWIADRVGIKFPLSVGTFLCAPLVICFVFARSTTNIFLVFLFWGIIRAAIFGPGRGYIGHTSSATNKATSMAIFTAILAIARGLGSLASGFIADNWGYYWTFYSSAIISILAGLLVITGMRKIPLLKHGTKTPPPPAYAPPSQKSTALSHFFIIQCLLATLYFLGLGANSFLPLLAAQVAGLSATRVGILITVGWVTTALLLFPLGKLADQKNKKVLMALGLLLSAFSFAGIAFSKNFPLLVVFVVLSSLSSAMFTPAAVALLSNIMPSHRQGTAMGIYGAAEDVGIIIGSGLGGVAWTAFNPSATFLTSSVAAVLGVIICLGFVTESDQERRP